MVVLWCFLECVRACVCAVLAACAREPSPLRARHAGRYRAPRARPAPMAGTAGRAAMLGALRQLGVAARLTDYALARVSEASDAATQAMAHSGQSRQRLEAAVCQCSEMVRAASVLAGRCRAGVWPNCAASANFDQTWPALGQLWAEI